MDRGKNHLILRGTMRLALKWLAPEGMEKKRFSQASDVWSFAITIWEVLTYVLSSSWFRPATNWNFRWIYTLHAVHIYICMYFFYLIFLHKKKSFCRYGATPYGRVKTSEIQAKVLGGLRLDRPPMSAHLIFVNAFIIYCYYLLRVCVAGWDFIWFFDFFFVS